MTRSDDLAANARQWSADAQTAFNTWSVSGTYTLAKDNTIRETIRRLGVLMANIAEHLDHSGFDTP